jgi:predicted hotdog family 3-hydroxylacyl-ACP dehydratase
MMPRLKSGDVFETQVLADFAYFQFVRAHKDFGDLIRVFTSLHENRVVEIERATHEPSFLVFYSLKTFLKSPARVKLIGNAPLRDVDRRPIIVKTGHGPWHIFEEGKEDRMVSVLTATEAEIPETYEIVPHSWMLHLILKANGIDVKPSALVAPSIKPQADDETTYFLYFEKKADALGAFSQIANHESLKTLRATLKKGSETWELLLTGKVPLGEAVSVIEAISEEFNGDFDGFEAPMDG